MWFKQIQLFQLTDLENFDLEKLLGNLEPLRFRPCPPSLPNTYGWVSPVDEADAPLARAINGKIMLCLQIEEKILPATVVRQELNDKIKELESLRGEKVRQKEKLRIKDDVTMTLLSRAFSKYTRIYGYIDSKNHCLALGTTNAKKAEQFITLFKKCITENIAAYELRKLSAIITGWLKNNDHPSNFAIEKACILQDPQEKNRVIRCQQQNLFANSILAFIKDGCEVRQIALAWQDRINFTLAENLTINGIKFQDDILAAAKEYEAETKQQHFDADFLIMSETLAGLIIELLALFTKTKEQKQENELEEVMTA